MSGLAALVLASFACMVAVRLFRRGDEVERSVGRTARCISAIATVPLVSGIIVALAVSLGVAA